VKHTQSLRNLHRIRFNGQLVQMDSTGQRWIFYLSQGSIIYATGGNHLVRRWYRNLVTYFPKVPCYRLAWHIDLARLNALTFPAGWEYALVQLWLTQGKITDQQATKMINSAVAEVVFDAAQAVDVIDQVIPDNSLSQQRSWTEVEKAIADAEGLWNVWQTANLTEYSPNWGLTLTKPEQLRANSSEQFYQTLANLLNGQHTLRDLGVKTQRDVVEVASSLLPFFRLKWVVSTTIPDLPGPFFRQSLSKKPPTSMALVADISRARPEQKRDFALRSPSITSQKSLIACVDDSPLVLQTLEKLLTSANYQFVGVNNPLQAIGVLLARKPDLIFLDLVMPKANGYEICEQLRKTSGFRNTPIVILTSSSSTVNRIRSDLVGASDFLSKPLDTYAVLNIVHKYL
jgi:two-component system, chemotaxis family, response regulator PixG